MGSVISEHVGFRSKAVGFSSKGVGYSSKGVGCGGQPHDWLNKTESFCGESDVFRQKTDEYSSLPVVNGMKADGIRFRPVSFEPCLGRFASIPVGSRTKTAAYRLQTDAFLSKTAHNPSILDAPQARNDRNRD
jgi:hypothetical protein